MKTIFNTQLTDVKDYDAEGLGTLRFEGNKVYKWVKLRNVTATVAAAAGSMVAYLNETGMATNTVVVDLSDACNPPLAAGATLVAITGTLATVYYCWIQIKGLITVDTAITNGADGVPLTLTTTDKTLARANEADSAAVYKPICAKAEDASAKTVALDCPF
jgi:hypothetical protein